MEQMPPQPEKAGKLETGRPEEGGIIPTGSGHVSAASNALLQEQLDGLHNDLTLVIIGEKELRIQRFALSAERERLNRRVLDFRKERLRKESLTASRRSKLNALRREMKEGLESEIKNLEEQVRELQEEVDAFRETLMLHRRDRDRVYNILVTAQSDLQDKLTESMLWKIVGLEESQDEKPGRRGKSGVVAELLGRLLVLEKEEAQLSSVIYRNQDR
jgi:hypothetical protein